ncbi:MAG: glycosyltransferase family 39 protein [Candidatus Bathyarchaeota archaeon]|nr:MAG: glycosyltransferase family 39 protein [Candidatus Bathyarchaeota archaeon]
MVNSIGVLFSLISAYFLPGFLISKIIFPRKTITISERILLSFGLSPGVVTVLVVILSMLGVQMTPQIFFLLISSLSLVFYVISKKRHIRPTENIAHTRDTSILPKPLLLALISAFFILLFFIFYHSLLFPIVNWDSLTEFAYLGTLFFEEGTIPLITGGTLGIHSSANYPPLVPTLYTWFYLFSGGIHEGLAKAVSPIFCSITALTTFLFVRRMYNSNEIAWSSVFFLVSTPIVMFVSMDCLADAPFMFYFSSSIYFLYISMTKERLKYPAVIASGLLGGLCAWTKYNGLFLIPVVCSILFVDCWYTRRKPVLERDTWKLFGIFLFSFAVFGFGWYLRNWILTGNPVYPLLYSIFGGKNIDPWLFETGFNGHFAKIREVAGLSFTLPNGLLSFFTIFIKPSPYEALDLGPFLGSFLLLAIFFIRRKSQRSDVFLLSWSLSYLLLWRFTTSTFLRYLVVVIPALAILSGNALIQLHVRYKSIKQNLTKQILLSLTFFLILCGFCLPTLINVTRGYKTPAFSAPTISSDEFLQRHFLGVWDAINYINQLTPDDAIILTYDHSVSYYLTRRLLFVDEPQLKPLHIGHSNEEILSLLHDYNVTHILLVNRDFRQQYFPLFTQSTLYSFLDDSWAFTKVLDVFPAELYAVN